MNIVQKAFKFQVKAHKGQKRKYTFEDYSDHPVEVSLILLEVCHSQVMHAAAHLHDTVEDTDVTGDDIYREFGLEIYNLVWELTDQSKPSDGNRATRKAIDREHLAKASADAQTIKLADLISNTRTIKEHDPKFWKVYRVEALALLEVLTKGNSVLHERLTELLK